MVYVGGHLLRQVALQQPEDVVGRGVTPVGVPGSTPTAPASTRVGRSPTPHAPPTTAARTTSPRTPDAVVAAGHREPARRSVDGSGPGCSRLPGVGLGGLPGPHLTSLTVIQPGRRHRAAAVGDRRPGLHLGHHSPPRGRARLRLVDAGHFIVMAAGALACGLAFGPVPVREAAAAGVIVAATGRAGRVVGAAAGRGVRSTGRARPPQRPGGGHDRDRPRPPGAVAVEDGGSVTVGPRSSRPPSTWWPR